MSRFLRLLVVGAVIALAGCGKKSDAGAQGSPLTSQRQPAAAPASSAMEPATATTMSAAQEPAAARTEEGPRGLPGELPMIAKARAFLGSDEALDGIRSIHYTGTLVTNDPEDPKKQTRAAIEIILEKPDRQRVTITSDKTIETTALDGYDGWTRITAAQDPTKWQQTLLGVDGIKRLRANTWENLSFFRGLEQEGGSVQDLGPATIDGLACEKVAFVHAANIIFYRFFDAKTGKVVYSETESGGSIREQGEITVNGVRFPKTIVTVAKNQGSHLQTVTITFDKIALNEPFADDYFSVPRLISR